MFMYIGPRCFCSEALSSSDFTSSSFSFFLFLFFMSFLARFAAFSSSVSGGFQLLQELN